MRKIQLIFLFMIGLHYLTACSQLGVEPWERNVLAKPEMQFSTSMSDAFDEHIYFSKEASSGGASFAGGGCGCN